MVLERARTGRVFVVLGLALVGVGAVLALKPFTTRIQLPDAAEFAADGILADCRAPVIAAWNTETIGELALWAVTRDMEGSGYEVRSGQGPYCAGPARRRFGVALAAALGGAALAVAGLKAARPS